MSDIRHYIMDKAKNTGEIFMEQAAELLKEFVSEKLSGEWKNFHEFDFRTLGDSEKFGCPGRNFDCDDTNIMRAVYVVLWGEELPGLRMDNFGYRKQYRGDTVNTFHTMFGREIAGRPGFFAGLEKYHPSDELREKVRCFRKLCSTIGNYVVLPNYFAEQTSLNCYRGTNGWHDFFDLFLIELHKVLTASGSADETLEKLVKVNNFCFSKFQGEAGFSTLTEKLFLSDYCSSGGIPQKIFAMNYHWLNEKAPEQYFQAAELYLEKTRKIICARAGKIITALQNKLPPA